MRKRSSSRKQKASPSPSPPPPSLSLPRDSLQSIFNIIATGSSSRKSKTRGRLHCRTNGHDTSGLAPPPPPPPASKGPTSIGDLKDFASSQLEDLKRRLDRSHSGISKDVDASRSRLHKRFEIHAQAIQQVTDEVDKEYKKIYEQIKETRKAMKATFVEFMDDAQTSTSHVCKTSILELLQSFDKAIDVLRNRLGVSAKENPRSKSNGFSFNLLGSEGSFEKLPSRGNRSHAAPRLHATLRSPKGFGPSPKKAKKTKKKPNGEYDSDEEDEDDEDDEEEDVRDQGVIPEVVTNRMMNRMGGLGRRPALRRAFVLPILLLPQGGAQDRCPHLGAFHRVLLLLWVSSSGCELWHCVLQLGPSQGRLSPGLERGPEELACVLAVSLGR
ncbi:hypothetical protein NL676_010975 [Syzygium grande]|nr:hypothetical protein NL676_010975 [Syzygium grande]